MANELLEQYLDDGAVVELILNRPQSLNSLSTDLIKALADATARVARDANVRLVILKGAGGTFCAGGDLGQVRDAFGSRDGETGPLYDRTFIREGAETVRWLHEMPKVTLAVISGAAAGAGLALALACDIRIAASDAKLTTAFSKIGLSGDFGISYFLTAAVGAAKARELMMMAEVLTADDALRLGLVNSVVPPDRLMDECDHLSRKLTALSPTAVAGIKANLSYAARSALADVLDVESENLEIALNTNHFRNGVDTFFLQP
jgi:2-(1,2-epoxy-1,2-dihydrophenyl)acetyl-CoA isomerase